MTLMGFPALADLTDKNLLSFGTAMLKTGQIRRCQGLETHGKHVVAMRNTHNELFNRFSLKEAIVLFRNEI